MHTAQYFKFHLSLWISNTCSTYSVSTLNTTTICLLYHGLITKTYALCINEERNKRKELLSIWQYYPIGLWWNQMDCLSLLHNHTRRKSEKMVVKHLSVYFAQNHGKKTERKYMHKIIHFGMHWMKQAQFVQRKTRYCLRSANDIIH